MILFVLIDVYFFFVNFILFFLVFSFDFFFFLPQFVIMIVIDWKIKIKRVLLILFLFNCCFWKVLIVFLMFPKEKILYSLNRFDFILFQIDVFVIDSRLGFERNLKKNWKKKEIVIFLILIKESWWDIFLFIDVL